MNTYTVSFFGHCMIDNALEIENGFDCVLHPARKRRRMADHEVCKKARKKLSQYNEPIVES